MEKIKRKGRPRKLTSEKKAPYIPTGKKRGRPRKAESDKVKPKLSKGGKRGRPSKDESREKMSNLIKKTKYYSKNKTAIIVKINNGKYDMSYLVGRKVRIKESPNWLPKNSHYGVISYPGYEGVNMAFTEDELKFI